jgi:hypothetical protein
MRNPSQGTQKSFQFCFTARLDRTCGLQDPFLFNAKTFPIFMPNSSLHHNENTEKQNI